LLDIETVFEGEKITTRVEGTHVASGLTITGYEIHCGRIAGTSAISPFRIQRLTGNSLNELEGALHDDGQTFGTSIHGLFDAPKFRRYFLNEIRRRKGLQPLEVVRIEDEHAARGRAYDRFAQLLQKHLDIAAIAALIGIEPERLTH
jgi:adenosylcobyric acid synthase